jgi:hypothetical protein
MKQTQTLDQFICDLADDFVFDGSIRMYDVIKTDKGLVKVFIWSHVVSKQPV